MNERLGPIELFDGQPLPLETVLQLEKPLESPYEGFLFRGVNRDPNSVGLATPLDEFTGLPLPVVISEPKNKSSNAKIDFHHHFHPERDLIHADDAMLALRRSRGQNLPRWIHEHHHKYFAGPEFPESRKDTFASVVLACAGVVPRKAIDYSGKYETPRIVEVWDNSQYQKIVSSIKHEAQDKNKISRRIARAEIGKFFANYAIEQSFEDVISSTEIDEFLNTTNPIKRKELGNRMLGAAIRMSVEPVIPIHRALKKESIARKRKVELPAIVKDYFIPSKRPDYFIAIDEKLSVA